MVWKRGVPWFPPGAAGLFAALVAHRKGDGGAALIDWNSRCRPLLVAACERAGADNASAEDAVLRVEEEALRLVYADVSVRNELAWMARVVVNFRVDEWRRARRDREFTVALSRVPHPYVEEPGEEPPEPRLSLAEAVVLLPPPYREAACGRWVEGWDCETTLYFLEKWWSVGRERARRILAEATVMLRETMAGEDPRRRWPRRFSQQDSIVGTYPTLGELRHVGGERISDGAAERSGGES